MVSKFKKAIKRMLGLTVAFGIIFSLSAQDGFSEEKSVQEETKVGAILWQFPSLWKFQIDPEDAGLEKGWFKLNYNDKDWGNIYTTAIWRVQKPGYGYTGVGWYRYSFNIPKAFHGKKIWLHFDGLVGCSGRLYGEATVYVNGKNIGWTIDWFQPIKFDITRIINPKGENVVAVRISGGAELCGLNGAVMLVGTDNEFNPGHGSANPPRKPTSFRKIREKKTAKAIDKELIPFGTTSVSENQKFNVSPISFKGNGFVISSSGLYDAYITRSREFFRIHYPWDKPAKKGEYAGIQGKIKIPELKGRKAYIRFWRRDNYGGKTYNGTPAKYDMNPNVRFKQLKINNKLVWQEDTFGDEKEVFVTVDITKEVKKDEYNEITFSVADLADTPERFPITAHFGYVTLLIEDDKGISLAELRKEQEIRKLKPVKKVTYPEYNLNQIPLEVTNPTKTYRRNWPVVSGMAFPEGRLSDIRNLELTDNEGKFIPCQFEVQSMWLNGSIKWVLLSFLTDLSPDEKRTYKLNILEHHRKELQQAIQSHPDKGGCLIDNGVIKFELPSKGTNFLIGRVWFKNKLVCENALSGKAKFAIDISDGEVLKREIMVVDKGDFFISPEDRGKWQWHEELAKVKSVEWERKGLLHQTILIKGEYGNTGELQFETRIEVFKDCSHLQIEHIFIVAAEEGMMPIKYVRLKTEPVRGYARNVTIGTQEGSCLTTPLTNQKISLLQSEKDKFNLSMKDIKEEGEHASGWVSVNSKEGSILLGVRYFWQEYPKALTVSKRAITVDLLQSEDKPMWWEQGEQKSHELLLSFNDNSIETKELAEEFENFSKPVYAVNFRYLRTSGALGFMPAESLSKSHPESIRQVVDNSLFKEGGFQPLYGIANFGEYKGPWGQDYLNGYCDTAYGWFQLYVLSEDGFWFDKAEQYTRHLTDIDVNHFSNLRFDDGKGYLSGTIYGIHPGILRTIAGGETFKWHRRVCPGILKDIFLNGMDTYSFLTGKKRFYKTFVDMADYILHTSTQHQLAMSMRRYAVPGFSLMRAYNTTGDKRYLDGAGRVIDTCLRWEKHVPGCFTDKPVYLGYDPIWGNVNYTHSSMYYNYRSAANFMTEYLSRACRDLYLATGDNRYAQVVIGTAEWIWDELVTDDLRTHYSTGPSPAHYGSKPVYHWHGVFPLILSSRAFDLTQNQKYFGRVKELLEVVNPELEVFHVYSNSENFYYMENFMQEKDQ